jgi:hypothetical protein
MRSARFPLQGAGLTPQSRRHAARAGAIFPVDRPPFPPLVSATMKTALILVGKRVGKAV